MENCVIVASKQDEAGLNIAQRLIEEHSFEKTGEAFDESPIYRRGEVRLVFSARDIIHTDHVDRCFAPESYAFISRHSSETGVPTLTAHFPGNFADNPHGGNPRQLSITHPSLLKRYIENLWALRNESPSYRVVVEATHHGPTSLERPVLFIEIGSTNKEWGDAEAAGIVAKALMKSLAAHPRGWRVGVGFGGPHYSEKFTRFIAESQYALGAIASKYALKHLDEAVIRQMVERCIEKVKHAVVDSKGMAKEKTRIMSLLDRMGLDVVRI